MDLGFAISASAANADKTFKLMKEAVKAVVDKYGITKIKYGLIVFGTTPISSKNFRESFPTPEDMKNFVDVVRRQSGQPDLAMALEEGRRLFDRAAKRPNARRVLVVIVDNKSVNNPEDIKRASKSLENKNIKVIAVSVGQAADTKEMEHISSDKDRVIHVNKDEKPEALADKIISKATTKGELT